MDARILELIKNPENISEQDLELIEKFSAETPYAQALRALKLKAIHKYSQENYPKILSETAAYTTDKKILYQLINGKPEKIREVEKTIVPTEEKPATPTENKYQKLPEILPIDPPKAVYINGALNRILFEGEENFMNEDAPKIDLELTKESGQIALAKIPAEEIPADEKQAEIQNNDATETPEQTVEAEINFYQSEDFLPKTVMPPKHENFTPKTASSKQTNAELEMLRLIAEVEAKMQKNKKTEPKKETEETISGEINFAETQAFEVEKSQPKEEQKEMVQENNGWKPMNFLPNTPDAAINTQKNKTTPEVPQPKNIPEETKTNVENSVLEKISEPEKSNVPAFINTWQSWLKISPKKEEIISEEISEAETKALPELETQAENVPEKKEQIIETFIENNPKISRLKEDAQFSIREKDDDISHLMTETLAKLYLEQRLYSKAMNAYEILIKKFPERKKEFSQRITEIKDLRPGK